MTGKNHGTRKDVKASTITTDYSILLSNFTNSSLSLVKVVFLVSLIKHVTSSAADIACVQELPNPKETNGQHCSIITDLLSKFRTFSSSLH
jgi:hypothetical protein